MKRGYGAAGRYWRAVARRLRCSAAQKKALRARAAETLSLFSEENCAAPYEELVRSLGEPRAFAREIEAALDPGEVRLYRRRQRIGTGALAVCAAAAICAAALLLGCGARKPPFPEPVPIPEMPEGTVRMQQEEGYGWYYLLPDGTKVDGNTFEVME